MHVASQDSILIDQVIYLPMLCSGFDLDEVAEFGDELDKDFEDIDGASFMDADLMMDEQGKKFHVDEEKFDSER
jgi:hypothetical protein